MRQFARNSISVFVWFQALGLVACGGSTDQQTSGAGGVPGIGGNPSGGQTNAAGTSNSAGSANTGGAQATGGDNGNTGGSTSSAGSLGGVGATGGSHATGGISSSGGTGTLVIGTGSCVAPCGAALATNTIYTASGFSTGATLYYDSTSGQFALRNNPDHAPANATAIALFTYSSTEGYSVETQGSLWFAFTKNYLYSSGFSGYSLALNNVVTVELVDAMDGQTYIVRFSFQTQSVTIVEVRVASCDPTKNTVCQNPTDCPSVASGSTSNLSTTCAACYTDFAKC